jgi:hypothetical protein
MHSLVFDNIFGSATVFTSPCNYYKLLNHGPRSAETCRTWASNFFIATCRTRYCGWIHGSQVEKKNSGTPNRLNYSVTVMVYTLFTTVARGLTVQPDGPQVGDPWCRT